MIDFDSSTFNFTVYVPYIPNPIINLIINLFRKKILYLIKVGIFAFSESELNDKINDIIL